MPLASLSRAVTFGHCRGTHLEPPQAQFLDTPLALPLLLCSGVCDHM